MVISLPPSKLRCVSSQEYSTLTINTWVRKLPVSGLDFCPTLTLANLGAPFLRVTKAVNGQPGSSWVLHSSLELSLVRDISKPLRLGRRELELRACFC